MKNCNISLSKNKLTYNGKAQKPTVTVKAGTRVLKTNSNYIISYSSNKKIGEATVTIKGKGQNYSGTVIKTFKIVPRATKIQQLAKGNHKLSVKWSIMKKQCNGYQIQYSTSDKFTKKATKKITVKSNKTTKKTIRKLKSNKKYYLRIRTYKTVNGKNYYSFWSKIQSIKL